MALTKDIENGQVNPDSNDEDSNSTDNDKEEADNNTSSANTEPVDVKNYDRKSNPDDDFKVIKSDNNTYTIVGIDNLTLTDSTKADALSKQENGNYEVTDGKYTYNISINTNNNSQKIIKATTQDNDGNSYTIEYNLTSNEYKYHVLDKDGETAHQENYFWNDKGETQKFEGLVKNENNESYFKVTNRDGETYRKSTTTSSEGGKYTYYADADGYENYQFDCEADAIAATKAVEKYNQIQEAYGNLTPSEINCLGLNTLDTLMNNHKYNGNAIFDRLMNFEINDKNNEKLTKLDENTNRMEYYDIIMSIGTEGLDDWDRNRLGYYQNYLTGGLSDCRVSEETLKEMCKKLGVDVDNMDNFKNDSYDKGISFTTKTEEQYTVENGTGTAYTTNNYNTATGKENSVVTKSTVYDSGRCTESTTTYNKNGSISYEMNSYKNTEAKNQNNPDKTVNSETSAYGQKITTVKKGGATGIVEYSASGTPYKFNYNDTSYKIQNTKDGLRFVDKDGNPIDTNNDIYKHYINMLGESEKFW